MNTLRALYACVVLGALAAGCGQGAPAQSATDQAPKAGTVVPKAETGKKGGTKGVSEDDIQLGPGATGSESRAGTKASGSPASVRLTDRDMGRLQRHAARGAPGRPVACWQHSAERDRLDESNRSDRSGLGGVSATRERLLVSRTSQRQDLLPGKASHSIKPWGLGCGPAARFAPITQSPNPRPHTPPFRPVLQNRDHSIRSIGPLTASGISNSDA